MISPPTTIEQLTKRASQLAGKTMQQLAVMHDVKVPENLKTQKGWQGQFLEQCLGADAGNLAQPDFSLLDIELKTLPIDYSGKVQESTYVSVVNISNNVGLQWKDSAVYHKLRHVLWVPIAHEKGASTIESQIATPFFWQMNSQEEAQLKDDWENAMELISMGQVDKINARIGEFLQVRPKAAHSRVLTKATDENGDLGQTLPRGFYLRSVFTQGLLERYLRL
jgi:DNA mismatch repair protein MutH